jgi:hypothetical protein
MQKSKFRMWVMFTPSEHNIRLLCFVIVLSGRIPKELAISLTYVCVYRAREKKRERNACKQHKTTPSQLQIATRRRIPQSQVFECIVAPHGQQDCNIEFPPSAVTEDNLTFRPPVPHRSRHASCFVYR